MKKYMLLSLSVLFFFACEKDETKTKNINVETQEWFIALKTPCDENTICGTFINKAVYNNDTVYFTTLVGPLCDYIFSADLLNINGELVKHYAFSDLAAFNNEVSNIETIYNCYND